MTTPVNRNELGELPGLTLSGHSLDYAIHHRGHRKQVLATVVQREFRVEVGVEFSLVRF